MISHMGTQLIETNRLILRKYETTDADDMFSNWVTDPEVSRFWGWKPHKNIDETKTLLYGWIEDYKKQDTYHWVIVFKSVMQAIGYIYLSEFDNTDDSVAVHYALSRKYWNKGIVTEACNGIFNFAFSNLHVKRIHSRHHIDNPASGRVMKKCGMRYIKTEHRQIPDCEEISGNYCYYEIEADDYKRML